MITHIFRITKHFYIFVFPIPCLVRFLILPRYDRRGYAGCVVEHIYKLIQIWYDAEPSSHDQHLRYFIPLLSGVLKKLLSDGDPCHEHILRRRSPLHEAFLHLICRSQIGVCLRGYPLRMYTDIRDTGNKRDPAPCLLNIRGN